jgi:hypothetical protein
VPARRSLCSSACTVLRGVSGSGGVLRRSPATNARRLPWWACVLAAVRPLSAVGRPLGLMLRASQLGRDRALAADFMARARAELADNSDRRHAERSLVAHVRVCVCAAHLGLTGTWAGARSVRAAVRAAHRDAEDAGRTPTLAAGAGRPCAPRADRGGMGCCAGWRGGRLTGDVGGGDLRRMQGVPAGQGGSGVHVLCCARRA